MNDVDTEDSEEMEGVEFIYDDEGLPAKVVIDLSLHHELWENIYDVWLAERRRDEPRESWEEVKQHLRELGKLEEEPATAGI